MREIWILQWGCATISEIKQEETWAANLGLAAWVLGLGKYELDYGCMAVASWLFGVGLLWLGCGLRAATS
jgi:hypothetical protein